MREFTVFDVESDLAHFRRPYTTTSALTFPIPPRTALCGLVGAILGLPKNDGLAELTDEKAVFGLLTAAPLSLTQYSFNLVDTKDNPSFRLKPENPHTQVRYGASVFRAIGSHSAILHMHRIFDACWPKGRSSIPLALDLHGWSRGLRAFALSTANSLPSPLKHLIDA